MKLSKRKHFEANKLSLLLVLVILCTCLAPEVALANFQWPAQLYQNLEPLRMYSVGNQPQTGPNFPLVNHFDHQSSQLSPVVAPISDSFLGPQLEYQTVPNQQEARSNPTRPEVGTIPPLVTGSSSAQPQAVANQQVETERPANHESGSRMVKELAISAQGIQLPSVATTEASKATEEVKIVQPVMQINEKSPSDIKLPLVGKIQETLPSSSDTKMSANQAPQKQLKQAQQFESSSNSSGISNINAYTKSLAVATNAIQLLSPRKSSNGKQSIAALEQRIISQHAPQNGLSARISQNNRSPPPLKQHKDVSYHYHRDFSTSGSNRSRGSLQALLEGLVSGVNSRSGSIVKAMGDNRLARTLSTVGKTLGSNKYVAGAAAASALAALGLTMSKLFSPYPFASKYSDPLMSSGSVISPNVYIPDANANYAPYSGTIPSSGQLDSLFPSASYLSASQYEQPSGSFSGATSSPIGYDTYHSYQSSNPDYQLATAGAQFSPIDSASNKIFVVYEKESAPSNQLNSNSNSNEASVNGHYSQFYNSEPALSRTYQALRPSSQASPNLHNSDAGSTNKQPSQADQMMSAGSSSSTNYARRPQAVHPAWLPSPTGGQGGGSARRSGSVSLKLDQATREKLLQKQNQSKMMQRSPIMSSGSFVPIVQAGQLLQTASERAQLESANSRKLTRSYASEGSSWLPSNKMNELQSDELIPSLHQASDWQQQHQPSVNPNSAEMQVSESQHRSSPLTSNPELHIQPSASKSKRKQSSTTSSSYQKAAIFEDTNGTASLSSQLADFYSDPMAQQMASNGRARLMRMTNENLPEFRLNQQQESSTLARQRKKSIGGQSTLSNSAPNALTQIDPSNLKREDPELHLAEGLRFAPLASSQAREVTQAMLTLATNSSSILTANELQRTADSGEASSISERLKARNGQPMEEGELKVAMNNGMRLIDLDESSKLGAASSVGAASAEQTMLTTTTAPAVASANEPSSQTAELNTNNELGISPNSTTANSQLSLGPAEFRPPSSSSAAMFNLEDSIQEAPSVVVATSVAAEPSVSSLTPKDDGDRHIFDERLAQLDSKTTKQPPSLTGKLDSTASGTSFDFLRGKLAQQQQLIEVVPAPPQMVATLSGESTETNGLYQQKFSKFANHQEKYQATNERPSGEESLSRSSFGSQWPLNGYL